MCPTCNGMGSRTIWVGSTMRVQRCAACNGTGAPLMRQDQHRGCLGPLLWLVAGVVAVCGLCGIFVLPRFDNGQNGFGARGRDERPGEVLMSTLATGDCYLAGSEPFQVRRTPCDAAHDGEIIASFAADTNVYYTDDRIDAECWTLFSPAVQDMLTQAELRPNNMWDVPHDQVICAALRAQNAAPLTGHLP
jgi:hypothetical protein